ncbi:N-acyl-D-amino-acid deacylase family protein [Desulfosarcina sp.]|uniref:N-acyl-D-amino-acid deacylase family protein n=1 Tax=Desulfosarcina sp. TaxID=2027861 RepID=UPI0039710D29
MSKGRVQVVERRGLPTTSDTLIFKAHGRIVCPGFIDVHAHDDLYLLAHPDGEFKVKQGVTTVIGGNCGVSPAPMSHAYRNDQLEQLRLLGTDGLPSAQNEFTDFGTYLAALDAAGLGIHYAGQVGHGMLRLAVMGPSSHAPSKAQTARMRLLLESCLDQGAIGLSLGLIYAPGAYADLSELVDLARVVQSRQGIVSAHIRSEGGRVVEAVAEMIELARQSEAAVHISHHKTADPANRGKSRQTLALIDRARQAGLRVTLDAYPYRAGSTYLAAVLPVESLADGVATLRVRLKDPSFRAQLRRKIESDPLDRWQSLLTGRDTYRLTIATCSTRPDYIGRCVREIADAEGISPHDLVFDLIAAEGLGVGMISHAMDEEDVQRILSHPATMIGSDGIPPSRDSAPHPRLTGTFPRILGRYVRELGLIDLSEAVRRMTSLPAATFGLTGKGRLAPGMDADLVVFDPLTVIDRSTYEQPYQPPEGIELVLIGGCPALIRDRLTYAAQGCVLAQTR